MEEFISSSVSNTKFSDVVGEFMNASTHNIDFRYAMQSIISPHQQINLSTTNNQLAVYLPKKMEEIDGTHLEPLVEDTTSVVTDTKSQSTSLNSDIVLPSQDAKIVTAQNMENDVNSLTEVEAKNIPSSKDSVLKVDILSLNEHLESKKGAVKRKARLPRQSVDVKSNKKNKEKKKKTRVKDNVRRKEEAVSTLNSLIVENSIADNPTKVNTSLPEEIPTKRAKPSNKSSKAKEQKQQETKQTPNLKCMVCDRELSNEQNLMKHLLAHNNNHTCTKCMKTFKSTHFLKHHMDKHNDAYNYTCTICNKKFKFRNNMKGHMRKHNMEKKFECTVCQKKFIGKYNLKEHMKAHSEVRPFGCDFCKKAYKDRGALNKHLLTHQEKKVECKICKRPFTNQTQVDRHMQFHYSWPGDSFKRKSNVDENGEKLKYKCDHCDKTFNHYSNMNAHIHKKHKEKKIQCPECPKLFAYQYELREHMFIHFGAQTSKFKCQVCDKSFQRSTTLKNHERTTHLGIKRFKCEVCGKMFGTKFNMKVHVDKLHNDNHVSSVSVTKPKRARNTQKTVTERIIPCPDDLTSQIPLPTAGPPPEHHLLPHLPVALQPPHQHPLLRNISTSDIIRNAMSHIPELGYFPPLQPHPTRGYQFYGMPPSDFGVS